MYFVYSKTYHYHTNCWEAQAVKDSHLWHLYNLQHNISTGSVTYETIRVAEEDLKDTLLKFNIFQPNLTGFYFIHHFKLLCVFVCERSLFILQSQQIIPFFTNHLYKPTIIVYGVFAGKPFLYVYLSYILNIIETRDGTYVKPYVYAACQR